ncbi:phospholipase A1-Igamma1, chloroplastic-like [Cryptomeria japonica]|uniref:phospholipase A1-Igamma1, chloroplastic-like n=1 Tax=Cryptomeria japonica TaxID=3369 RepID=UPI0027DA61F7|nr:phospholipase A1-Igamma1, chloroplastic-like [Cryptomeria japonica]
MAVFPLPQLEDNAVLLPSSQTNSTQPQLCDVWRDIQGAHNWNGLLDPMVPNLKAEALRYGNLAQLCYDAFDGKSYSKNYGTCYHSKRYLFNKMGMSESGYQVTKYVYANTNLLNQVFGEKPKDQGVWLGFIAVCTDPNEIRRLGRRDIVIAWRGTQTAWRYSCAAGATVNISSRDLVVSEIERLIQVYEKEMDNLSITFTGHSLGAALATLSAYDIKQMLCAKHNFHQIPVTVFAFASPRVGNPAFAKRVEEIGVKVLRFVNKRDLVPKVPGVCMNENVGCLSKLLHWLPWTYFHVGVELPLHNNSPFIQHTHNLAYFHNLELYLHLLDGYVGSKQPFSWSGRDHALVNKSCDLLREKYEIPPKWWQEQNKGLVKGPDGKWTQPSEEE